MSKKVNNCKMPVFNETDRTFVSETPFDGYYDGLWYMPDEDLSLPNVETVKPIPNFRPYVSCAIINTGHLMLMDRALRFRSGRAFEYLLDVRKIRQILDP